MKLKRIMIAAPKSGSGKTTITCALLQALKNKGNRVVSYKCGPDYIDPMFHQKVIDIPSKNLDTFFTGEEETKRLFLKNRSKEDFAVLEGVMGMFDGLGGVREEGSSYHLAKVTKTPIILVVDAKGMGRSVIPLIAGFLSYDKEHLIKGVILNRMSKFYYETIKPVIEEELHILVIGYFPDYKQFHIESRHLGLLLPDEITDIQEQLQEISKELEMTVSMEQMIQIAEEAEELECSDTKFYNESLVINNKILTDGLSQQNAFDAAKSPVIAVAKDEAFCFYYEDNLLMLQELGAKIEYFSPLHDTQLPDDCDGLLLGGGYPELYVKELSNNESMRKAVKQASDNKMPVVAECGGFMYLHSEIIDREGIHYAMAGVIPAACSDRGKLVRFGYIEITEKESCFLPEGEKIKAHEFHYYDSTNNGKSCIAVKPVTGKEYSCIVENENCWMGFPHLYYPSNPAFAKSFIEKAIKYKMCSKT